jgi:exocyst complex component 1
VIKEYNGKDVRKHVDVLFKRVEKHFTIEEKAGETPAVKPSGTFDLAH